MIRQGLCETVKRVESMAGVRCRHDPLVVGFVKMLVHKRVVKVSMDPVDAEVGEEQEKRELKDVVPHSRTFLGTIVQLAIASDFKEEEGRSADSHEWH